MRVELYYDYASPWSYLANAVLARELPGRTIDYHPVYLRGLETFANGMPYTPAKLQYLFHDFQRCAAHEGVTIGAPANFPINGVHALRAALVAQEIGGFEVLHEPLFNAAWRDGKDVGNAGVIKGILAELGLHQVAERLEDPAIKAKLRADTEAAVKRGVFGAPTFFVGEEMYWGHDRLAYVARASAG